MTPHKQELEDNNSKTESIVILGSHNAVQVLTLKFRRRMSNLTDAAHICATLPSDLETVAVNELNCCLFGNQNATMIDVSYYMTVIVNYLERSSDVGGGLQQEGPVSVWILHKTILHTIEQMNRFVVHDLGHQKTDQSPTGTVK